MENKPDIKTAIPQQRYQLGQFSVTILGDIETGDANDYRYILAVVHEGNPEPGLYLTCEPAPQEARDKGHWAMRLILPDGAQVFAADDAWDDIDAFARDGLAAVQQLLQLTDEEPFRLV